MKKLIPNFFVIITLCFALQANAQSKIGIALGNSNNPARLSAGDVSSYEAAALSGIRETNICTTLERAEWKKILEERGVQKTEEFLDGKIIPQSSSLGAEYLLLLSIQSMNVTDNKVRYDDYTLRKVKADLIIGAKLVSVETGVLKYNKVITMSDSDSYGQKSEMYNASRDEIKQSFRKAFIEKCTKEFSTFAFEVFPPDVSILKVKTSKRNKAKTVLCKTNGKLRKGVRLTVFTEEPLDLGDGEVEIISNTIGELKIIEIQSSRIILCKVTKGGEEILKGIENKTALKCKPDFNRSAFEILDVFKG